MEQFHIYGFPDECQKFTERHPRWFEAMSNVGSTVNLAFTRVETMENEVDKLIYFMGRTCAEDFNEITLVCYHGQGVAAAKLLRSMYEHAATLNYLHEHPDEVPKFIAFARIQNEKLANRLAETFGENILPAEDLQRIRRNAAEVKNDFMVPECDHPGAKMRVNHSWNKLHFVAMAQRTPLGKLILPGYFGPLRHAHASFAGLTERLEIVDGVMRPATESSPNLVDRSLMTAHVSLLNAIWVQDQRFKLEGLREALQICQQDFLRIWQAESPA